MSSRTFLGNPPPEQSISDDAALLLDAALQQHLQQGTVGGRNRAVDALELHPDVAAQLPPLLKVVQDLCVLKAGGAAPRKSLTDFQPPQQLGDFRIQREIGRGGMGVVYEACQVSLDRTVALKVLPQRTWESQEIERFHREAKIAASLHHSNVVPIFAYGESDGYYYFAMQIIPGCSLNQLAARKTFFSIPGLFTARWIADVGLQAAEALQYAHQQKTLHRDIKPSNLLLDQNGRVWVSDFGLACFFADDEDETIGQSGTALFQAPERSIGKCDFRSEVYSLGATLLNLAGAFRPDDRDHSTVSDDHPVDRTNGHTPPSRPPVRLPLDLSAILRKAVHQNPDQRYQTAGDMAADLRRYLEGRPVHARKTSWIGSLSRWSRRNPSLAAAIVTIALLMVATSGVLLLGQIRFRTMNDELIKANEVLVKHNRSLTQASFAVDAAVRRAVTRVETADADNTSPYEEEDFEILEIPDGRFQSKAGPSFKQLLTRLTNSKLQLNGDPEHYQLDDGLLAASASSRIGNVMYSLGHLKEAEVAAKYSLELIGRCESQTTAPDASLYLLKAQALNDLAELEDNRLNHAEADRLQTLALNALQSATGLSSLDQYMNEFGRAHLGLIHRIHGRHPALHLLQQVVRSQHGLVGLPPSMTDSRSDFHQTQIRKYLVTEQYANENNAYAQLLTAQCLLERARDERCTFQDRERDFKMGVHFLEKAVIESNWNSRYVFQLARGLSSVPLFGWSESPKLDVEIAAPCLELARKLLARLVKSSPRSPEFAAALADTDFRLAVLAGLSGDDLTARSYFRACTRAMDSLLKNASPAASGYLDQQKAVYLAAYAIHLNQQNESELARSLLDEASDTLACVKPSTESRRTRLLLQSLIESQFPDGPFRPNGLIATPSVQTLAE